MLFRRASLFAFVLLLAAPAIAQTPEHGIVRFAEELQYKGLPGTPLYSVLYGDAAKPELYVMRVKFAPGVKVMPHSHPEQVRIVTVVSGTFYYAFGDTFDESKLQRMPAGTMFTEPARVPHFAWAKDGEVILQLTAVGPTGTFEVVK
jgi:quercetin dioxygenase-like cupin family protein